MTNTRPILRIMTWLLTITMILNILPLTVSAEGENGIAAAVCTHIHDQSCNYTELSPCTHQHDENCGGLEKSGSGNAPRTLGQSIPDTGRGPVARSSDSWSLPAARGDVTGNPTGQWTFLKGTIDSSTPYDHATEYTDPWGLGGFYRTSDTAVGRNGGLYELWSDSSSAYPIIQFTAPATGTYTIAPIVYERRNGWDNGDPARFLLASNGVQVDQSEPVSIGDNSTTFTPAPIGLTAGDTLEFYVPSSSDSVDALFNGIQITRVESDWSLPAARGDVIGNPIGQWAFLKGTIDSSALYDHSTEYIDPWGLGGFFRTSDTAVGRNGGLYELWSDSPGAYPIIRFTAPATGTYVVAPITYERRNGWDNGGPARFLIASNGVPVHQSEPVSAGDNSTTFTPDPIGLTAGDTLEFYVPSSSDSVDALFDAIHISLTFGKAPVVIAPGSAIAAFGAGEIDLDAVYGLFTLPPSAGARTYTIEPGTTGEGVINNGHLLSATTPGIFQIGLVTQETETHAAGVKAVASLTVTTDPIFDPSNPHRPGGMWLLPNEQVVTHTLQGVTLAFNKTTGDLMGVDNGTTRLHLDSGYVDAGVSDSTSSLASGNWARSTISWQNYDELAPWGLPSGSGFHTDAEQNPPSGTIVSAGDAVTVTNVIDNLQIETTYRVVRGNVEVSAAVSNLSGSQVTINGMTFALKNLRVTENSLYKFPGTTPAGEFSAVSSTNTTRFSSPVTQLDSGGRHFNLMFINENEKWGTRTVGAAGGRFSLLNVTSVLSHLEPGASLDCGAAYIQMVQPGGDQYKAVRDFYTGKGWVAPTDGVQDGPIYFAWPYGTVDGIYGITRPDNPTKLDPNMLGDYVDYEYFNGGNKTRHLDDFAARLPDIKKWGFEILWLLPIYDFPGNDLYNPNNMEDINSIFGGNQAIAPGSPFRRALDDTGLIFLTDYAPHGPRWNQAGDNADVDTFDTYNPWFTGQNANRLDWVATHLTGEYRRIDDWRCVALDYANPDYLAYMRNLARTQVSAMGISGARIDAVMDTAPNWSPAPGNRPSNGNMKGSTLMSRAIRDGILDAGATPAMLPETFHPVPFYAPHTDFFYDMAFCEFLLNLRNQSGEDSAMFASETAKFLEMERLTKPEGLKHARFLANHDTVSHWNLGTYPGQRAWEYYGIERARALWVLISTIDGVPKIYQGDELMNNDKFFTDLFAARKQYLGTAYDIEYLHDNDSPIVAFQRFKGNDRRLVLINMGDAPATRDFTGDNRFQTLSPLYTNDATDSNSSNPVTVDGAVITLQPYSSVIFDLSRGDGGVTPPNESNTSSRSSSSSPTSAVTPVVAKALAIPPVTLAKALSLTDKAVAAAKASGGNHATITFKNVGEITQAIMQSMVKAAGSIRLTIQADSVQNKAVDVRLSFDPADATKTVNLTASTISSDAKTVGNLFKKHFANTVLVVCFEEKNNFGTQVNVAAKVPSGMADDGLVFYSYNRASNSYKRLPITEYRVDNNGYVHFTTSTAGTIVLSRGNLSKK